MFINILNTLNHLIDKSNNSPILLPNKDDSYKFLRIKRYTVDEIIHYENQYNITLPNNYKDFLIHVGACKLYIDEYGPGIEFMSLEQITEFSKQVFATRTNHFPYLFFIASDTRTGDIIGFNLKNKANNNLALYSIMLDDVDEWMTIDDFISLTDFLEKLILFQGDITQIF